MTTPKQTPATQDQILELLRKNLEVIPVSDIGALPSPAIRITNEEFRFYSRQYDSVIRGTLDVVYVPQKFILNPFSFKKYLTQLVSYRMADENVIKIIMKNFWDSLYAGELNNEISLMISMTYVDAWGSTINLVLSMQDVFNSVMTELGQQQNSTSNETSDENETAEIVENEKVVTPG